MTYLLDANVLIALIDLDHIHHQSAHSWFQRTGRKSWATCPITQNAVLRIMGARSYPHQPQGPAKVAQLLAEFCRLRGHQFWADSVSLLDNDLVVKEALLDSQQITDVYLLALAAEHDGTLATFDRKMATAAIHNGRSHIHMIGA